METAVIISGAAMLIALAGLVLNSRKETRQDAAGTARVEAKLDTIGTGVEDIRVEMRGMRGRIDGLAERLSAVEASCKSAHHRLDNLQKKGE